MNKELAPVILFTYNRPDHTKKVLDALAKNDLAKESNLFIFCDGPKNENGVEKVKATREVAINEKNNNRFKNVTVEISEKNKGLANSIIGGVTKIINEYGSVIVLEDDHLTSKSFLTFMNNSIEFYKENDKIWSISGFTYNLNSFKNYSHNVYLSYRACSHGWATWTDRWNKVDWKIKDYNDFLKSSDRIKQFNRGGNDLSRMLKHQMKGERDSWAIRFCYNQSKYNMYTVYPKVSLINNIGFDGTGTHCQNQDQSNSVNFCEENINIKLENIDLDNKILKEFKSKFNVSFTEAMLWVCNKIKGKLLNVRR